MNQYRQVLSNRRFALLWGGQTVSWFGDSLYTIALLWLVQELTGSRAMLGVVAACRSLPSLLGFVAGTLVDRWDRRRIMISADLLRGAIVLSVPLLSWAGLLRAWHLPVVAACLGVVAVFFAPARQALLPSLVSGDELIQANAMLTMSHQLVLATGFAAGGILISVVGIMPLYVIDTVTFAVSALAIFLMGSAPVTAPAPSATGAASPTEPAGPSAPAQPRLADDLRTGIRFVFRDPTLSRLLPLVLAMNFFIVPLWVLLPSWSRDVLGAGAAGYGFIQTAQMLGLVGGAMVVAAAAKRMRRSTLVMIAVSIQGLSLVALTLGRSLPVAIAAMAVFGFLDSVAVVTIQSHIQRIVPRAMLGRVFGAFETFAQILVPAGQTLGGIAGQLVALPVVFGVVAGLRLLGAGSMWVLSGLRSALDLINVSSDGAHGALGSAPATRAVQTAASE